MRQYSFAMNDSIINNILIIKVPIRFIVFLLNKISNFVLNYFINVMNLFYIKI